MGSWGVGCMHNAVLSCAVLGGTESSCCMDYWVVWAAGCLLCPLEQRAWHTVGLTVSPAAAAAAAAAPPPFPPPTQCA
jgi:hypothetical protein